jgi:hypothetical protein
VSITIKSSTFLVSLPLSKTIPWTTLTAWKQISISSHRSIYIHSCNEITYIYIYIYLNFQYIVFNVHFVTCHANCMNKRGSRKLSETILS